MTSSTDKETTMRFIATSIMGAVISNALLLFVQGFSELLSLSITSSLAFLLGLIAVAISVGLAIYMKPSRSWVYGISIGYLHGIVGGFLFNPSTLIKGLTMIPFFTLVIAPMPLMMGGLVSVMISKAVFKNK